MNSGNILLSTMQKEVKKDKTSCSSNKYPRKEENCAYRYIKNSAYAKGY